MYKTRKDTMRVNKETNWWLSASSEVPNYEQRGALMLRHWTVTIHEDSDGTDYAQVTVSPAQCYDVRTKTEMVDRVLELNEGSGIFDPEEDSGSELTLFCEWDCVRLDELAEILFGGY